MRLALAGLLIVLALPAFAEEPKGCDAFAWPLGVEKAALASSDKQTPNAGDELDRNSAEAITVALVPFQAATLSKPPERDPKNADSYAGAVSFAAGSGSGKYKVTLAEFAWIDVIQNGQYLKPVAFTGAHDCPGVRKSVEFELGAEPFVLQLSDVSAQTISVVLTPSD